VRLNFLLSDLDWPSDHLLGHSSSVFAYVLLSSLSSKLILWKMRIERLIIVKQTFSYQCLLLSESSSEISTKSRWRLSVFPYMNDMFHLAWLFPELNSLVS